MFNVTVKYKNYNTDSLATDGVTGLLPLNESTPQKNDKSLETVSKPRNVYFVAAGVRFDKANKLYVKLTTPTNAKLTVKKGNSVVAVYSDLADLTVYTGYITATEFDTVYTFELYEENVLVQTLTYSVNSYCYSMQNSENEKMKALATALYNFGVSAEAFKNTEKENKYYEN